MENKYALGMSSLSAAIDAMAKIKGDAGEVKVDLTALRRLLQTAMDDESNRGRELEAAIANATGARLMQYQEIIDQVSKCIDKIEGTEEAETVDEADVRPNMSMAAE